jgi:hypothetical protein
MEEGKGITSVESLTRATLFLFKAAGVIFVGSLLLALFLAYASGPTPSELDREILFGPTMLIFFVGVMIMLPIAVFKTTKWMLVMAFNVRDDVPAHKYWFNAFNTLFWPSYLTPKGLEARSNLLDALKWEGVVCLLGLLLFAMSHFSGVDF